MMICTIKNNKTVLKKREKKKGRERFTRMQFGLLGLFCFSSFLAMLILCFSTQVLCRGMHTTLVAMHGPSGYGVRA